MIERILGIDIGIASLGWAVVEFDGENRKNNKIIDCGVRIFDKAENPKTGESLALPRRSAKRLRKRLDRKARRLKALKNLFVQKNIITGEELKVLYDTSEHTKDSWLLRVEALNRALNKKEFARVLTHLLKHRGFKSMRKAEEKEGDVGKMKTAIETNAELMTKKGYLTFGQMVVYETKDGEAKRNRGGSYKNSISRSIIEQEAKIIFDKQRGFGVDFADTEFEKEFLEIFNSQKEPLDEEALRKMVGKCTFFPDEPRAPKASLSAETFVALTKIINNIKIIDSFFNERVLDGDEIEIVLNELFRVKAPTYKNLRKILALRDDEKFKFLDYKKDEKAENKSFFELKGFHTLKKAIIDASGDVIFVNLKNTPKFLDMVAEVLTYNKTDTEIVAKLQKLFENIELEPKIKQNIIEALKDIDTKDFRKFINLSFKALEKILPFMLIGHRYDDACRLADMHHSKRVEPKGLKSLPIATEKTTNPVVKRAVAQSRKVINAIIRKYNMPDKIHIELARELKHSYKERKKIEKGQKEYQVQREAAKKQALECGINPDEGDNLLRFRFWREQDERCPYCGDTLERSRLGEIGYAEIDHIIPYSRSLDDSLINKTLVHALCNQNKGDKTPFEFFGSDKGSEKWLEFIGRVESMRNIRKSKRNRFLMTAFDDERFKNRNLNDTQTLARYIKDYIRLNLAIDVESRNGSLTSHLRHIWGVGEKNRENHLHHAQDAIVLAFSTQSMVQKISTLTQKIETKGKNYLSKDEKLKFKLPMDDFRDKVDESIKKIFVSKAPRRKVGGAAHEETIRAKGDGNIVITKIKLESILDIKEKNSEKIFEKAKAKIESIVDKEHGNKALYEAIKERLEQYKGEKIKDAFKEPLYPKSKDGSNPNQIKSVKIAEVQNSGVDVRGGIAANGDMPRVDVFAKNGKFYLVPIYISDFAKGLPNKAITAKKRTENWDKIDESYEFMFSLYKNDLLEIKHKNKNPVLGYFSGVHSGTAYITITHPANLVISPFKAKKNKEDGSVKSIYEFGVKQGVEYFKKFQVSPLGEYIEIKKERRVGILKK